MNSPSDERPLSSGSEPEHDARSIGEKVDELVNECIDAEAAGELARARAFARQGRELDAGFDARLQSMRESLSPLGLLPKGRDFAAAVVIEADMRRPFIPRPSRRKVTRARFAAATAVLALIASVAAVHRYVPGLLTPTSRPAPVTDFVDASTADMSQSLRVLSGAVSDMRADLAAPAIDWSANEDGSRRIAFELRGPAMPWPMPRGSAVLADGSTASPMERRAMRENDRGMVDTRLSLGNTRQYRQPITDSLGVLVVQSAGSRGPLDFSAVSSGAERPADMTAWTATQLAEMLPVPIGGAFILDGRAFKPQIGVARAVPAPSFLTGSPSTATTIRADDPLGSQSPQERPKR